MDKAGTVFIDRGPSDGESFRPEIDRTVLRDLLLAALPPDTVAWGHKLVTCDRPGGSVTTLTFANGHTTSADLPRAAEAARQSASGLDMIFNDDAPKDLVRFFSSMEEPVRADQ